MIISYFPIRMIFDLLLHCHVFIRTFRFDANGVDNDHIKLALNEIHFKLSHFFRQWGDRTSWFDVTNWQQQPLMVENFSDQIVEQNIELERCLIGLGELDRSNMNVMRAVQTFANQYALKCINRSQPVPCSIYATKARDILFLLPTTDGINQTQFQGRLQIHRIDFLTLVSYITL